MSHVWIYRRADPSAVREAMSQRDRLGWDRFASLAERGPVPAGGDEVQLPGTVPYTVEPILLRCLEQRLSGANRTRAAALVPVALRGDGTVVSTKLSTGYGAPCLLAVEQVKAIRQAMGGLPPSVIEAHLDPSWIPLWLAKLVRWRALYIEAARRGQPVIITPV